MLLFLLACGGDYEDGYYDGCTAGQAHGSRVGHEAAETCDDPAFDDWLWDPLDPTGDGIDELTPYDEGLNDGYADCYWPIVMYVWEERCHDLL